MIMGSICVLKTCNSFFPLASWGCIHCYPICVLVAFDGISHGQCEMKILALLQWFTVSEEWRASVDLVRGQG